VNLAEYDQGNFYTRDRPGQLLSIFQNEFCGLETIQSKVKISFELRIKAQAETVQHPLEGSQPLVI
jgi:hypothetical protein